VVVSGAIFGAMGTADSVSAERMGACLAHRGPRQFILCPTSGVSLGRRMELALHRAAHVPILFHGTLSNRDALLALLAGDERLACEYDDARLMWSLHRRLGTDAFSHVAGSYEVALYDSDRRELVLALDHDACRPLYFAKLASGIAFATEIKAFRALKGFRLEPDAAAVNAWLRAETLADSATLFSGVQRLLPGEYCVASSTACSVGSIPRPHQSRDSQEGASLADLRRSIVAAARRWSADTEASIGVALTGGLGPVLALGAISYCDPGRQISTYAVGGDEHDPVFAHAAHVARRFQTRHREIVIPAETLRSLVPEMIWQVEDPTVSQTLLDYLLIAHQAAHEVSLLICGLWTTPVAAGAGGFISRTLRRYTKDASSGAAREPRASWPIAPLSRDLASLERLHAWAGTPFLPFFHDPEIRGCAQRLRVAMRGRRQRWSSLAMQVTAGIVPATLAKEALETDWLQRGGAVRAKRSSAFANWRRLLAEEWGLTFFGRESPEYAETISGADRRGEAHRSATAARVNAVPS
jgi:hypothetical protein